MGFDLQVFAVDPTATDDDVRRTAERCAGDDHPEGDLDARIVAFYQDLRTRYPDSPPYDGGMVWMSAPLEVGIDHVLMTMSFGRRSDPVVELVLALAEEHGLTVHDPQDQGVVRPTGWPRRGTIGG